MADNNSPFNSPWETWGDKQRAQADKAIDLLDGIKLYRSAGGVGVGGKYAGLSSQLTDRGGISPEEATQLSRYRMSKMLEKMQDAEGWQGPPMETPTGPRTPSDTPEQADARGQQFMNSAPEERRNLLATERERARQALIEEHFDNLVNKSSPKLASTGQDINITPVRMEKPSPPAALQLPEATTDDEKLTNAQLMMLYNLAKHTGQ